MGEDAKAESIPLEGCVAKVEVGAGCSLVPGHVDATRPNTQCTLLQERQAEHLVDNMA